MVSARTDRRRLSFPAILDGRIESMEPLHFLRDLLIVFAAAGTVVFLFHWLRAPSVVGLLIAGVLTGPQGLGWVRDTDHINALAEIGVVVLLFTVGLEFSLPRVASLGRLMAKVGIPQVAICVAAGVALTALKFGNVRPAIFAGILLAMSSTAVVFKILTDRGEMASPQGNIAAAVLLFQDLLVVVCMVLLSVLAAKGGDDHPLWQSLSQGTAAIVLLLFAGRFVAPLVLFQVVKTKNRELFLIVLALICLGSAALTGLMGWSLALGAFLAGLALSESEYATETLAEVLPFRDTLSSLFFVSVGMLLDLGFLAANLPVVLGIVLTVVVLKFMAAALPTLFLTGYPLRIAVLTGVALAQVGEFSFILADRGLALGIFDRAQYQMFLAAAVLTIAVTPLLIAGGPRLAELFAGLPLLVRWQAGCGLELPPHRVEVRKHVVIVGYGLCGRNLARVLQVADIEYLVLELNPETVRQARKHHEPVYYGDGVRPAVLKHLGVAEASLLVIAISDAASSRRMVQLARRMNPSLRIIVRTRYLAEVEPLRRLGANIIIPEEFETSVEIFSRVLTEYEVPQNLVLDLVERVRSDHYEMLRDTKSPAMRVVLPYANVLEKMEIRSCWIRDGSPARARTVGELNLRAATGATLLAVRRGRELVLNPGPDVCFRAGDIAILVGDHPQVDRGLCLLDPGFGEPIRPNGQA
jgi:CPA2 family monovalent cation:H+ antiporter-2